MDAKVTPIQPEVETYEPPDVMFIGMADDIIEGGCFDSPDSGGGSLLACNT